MKTDSIVYRKIVARIALLGYTRREVADLLGVSYGTLHNKLCHITPFTLDEAVKLHTLLNMPGSVQDSFQRFDEGRIA